MASPFAWRLAKLVPTRTPVRPQMILAICFAVAIILPVVYVAIILQAHEVYGKALVSQPLFLSTLVCGACITTLTAFPIIWRLRLRSYWIIDGVLLAAYFAFSRAMEFDLYFRDVYVVFSIRDLIFWVWTTLTIPLLWLTIRLR
jgi:hypothetical protein